MFATFSLLGYVNCLYYDNFQSSLKVLLLHTKKLGVTLTRCVLPSLCSKNWCQYKPHFNWIALLMLGTVAAVSVLTSWHDFSIQGTKDYWFWGRQHGSNSWHTITVQSQENHRLKSGQAFHKGWQSTILLFKFCMVAKLLWTELQTLQTKMNSADC